MKSSRLADWVAVFVVLLASAVIAALRAPLASSFLGVKNRSDAYLLPSPAWTKRASLGYRSALADLIFGHLLVAQGLRFQERRLFDEVGNYLETINELDPQYRTPYRYADTLLTLQPVPAPPELYRQARRILERGLRELPFDQELWSTSGQFMAYLAPPRLPSAEAEEFRKQGTRYLTRACELLGSNENVPYHCLTAAVLFNEQGERQALRQFLMRVIASSEDPEIQRIATGYLAKVEDVATADRFKARRKRFRAAWQADLSFVPLDEILALGPKFDLGACAGYLQSEAKDCSSSWSRWGRDVSFAIEDTLR